jgi:putative pyridoxal-dependent aspartate 1-decarboxylase
MTFDELVQKLFISQGNEAVCKQWLNEALHEVTHFIQNTAGDKIHSDVSLKRLEKVFHQLDFPLHGEPIEVVFNDTLKQVVKHSVRLASPYFVGHMTGLTPYFSLIAELFICALNQNVVKIETALSASFVEGQTLVWLHRLVYNFQETFYKFHIHNPNSSLGNVTSGGTVGNYTALAVAREMACPGVRKLGLMGAMKQNEISNFVVFASSRVHYSVKKACGLLGIGENAVVSIPVDSHTNKIRIDILKQEILVRKKQDKRLKILAIVGVAGSTETGSVDSLSELSEIAKAENTWFHVDAAWGAPMLFSAKEKNKLAGIELADSVTLDGHKLFYLPMSHGAVLFKNPNQLDLLKHNAQYIIREGSVDLGRTTLEGSRRFDSLKMWFFLKTFGHAGYRKLVDRSIQLTLQFAHLVEQTEEFELCSSPESNILTYRYIPKQLREKFKRIKIKSNSNTFNTFETELLNKINVEIQKQQRNNGKSFVSRTSLESLLSSTEKSVVLRVVLFNPLSTLEILASILEEQKTLGATIEQSSKTQGASPQATDTENLAQSKI